MLVKTLLLLFDCIKILKAQLKTELLWWLRCRGNNDNNAAYVNNDGNVNDNGNNADNEDGGVRVALLVMRIEAKVS